MPTLRGWLPVLGWMAAIVIAPLFLGSSLPSSSSVLDELLRSGIHVAEYGILAFLLHRALSEQGSRGAGRQGSTGAEEHSPLHLRTSAPPLRLAFLVAVLYAIFDEAQQSFIPNRQPSLLDVLADSLGSLLVLVGLALISRPSPQRPLSCNVSREPLLKRPFDLLLASLGLFFLFPFFPFLALAIKLEDAGPVLCSEERWGRGGTVFRIHKFRTTVVNPHSRALVEAELGHRRFTRVGKFLRARGVDELPQLLNILKGEMSFVGPRPLAVDDVTVQRKKEYAAGPRMAGFHERLSVRPGLTGIAQVFGSRYLSHRNKFRYDLLYVRRQSFLLDLRLLVLSLWVSLRGKWEARGKKL